MVDPVGSCVGPIEAVVSTAYWWDNLEAMQRKILLARTTANGGSRQPFENEPKD